MLPSGSMLANPHGTAPGWWVDRPDGRVIVTLPGPPREMRPMWANEVQPRLAARGVGLESVVRTLRLTGIGESLVAERLGEPLLRATNPIVATYARQEAVDVRISARAAGGVTAGELADAAEIGRARRAGRVRLGDRRHDLGRRAGRGAGRPRLDAGDGRERDVRRAGRAAAGRGGRSAVRGPLAANRRRPTGTRPATWRMPSAPARRPAPTSGWPSGRPRPATTPRCTSRWSRLTGGTRSGGSCSCAGAWARTDRPSPARPSCWRCCARRLARTVRTARRRRPSGGRPGAARAGRRSRSSRDPCGSARRRRTSPGAC